MSKLLRSTFLVHAIVALAFGLVMYLAPAWFGTIVRWSPIDPVMTAFVGAALIALGVSSWFGYRAEHWEDVRIVVLLEAVFTVTGTAVALYYLLLGSAPLFTWVPAILWGLFAVVWIVEYTLETRSHPHLAATH